MLEHLTRYSQSHILAEWSSQLSWPAIIEENNNNNLMNKRKHLSFQAVQVTVIIDVSALQVDPFKQIYSFLWNSSCACSGHHLDKILLITCESSFIATGLIRAP